MKMEKNKSKNLRFAEILKMNSKSKESEGSLESERAEDGIEVILDEMLSFLGKMPVDEYHDYRIFRHGGLRGYLINRFLREKWDK
jgi:hypothetical protein